MLLHYVLSLCALQPNLKGHREFSRSDCVIRGPWGMSEALILIMKHRKYAAGEPSKFIFTQCSVAVNQAYDPDRAPENG